MSINEELSFTEYTLTEDTTDFIISFDRIGGSTDEVSILVNNTPIEDLVGYTVTQVNFSTWQVDPALPTGTIVRLARTTNLDKMVYVFTAGSKFIAKNVDSNFQQIQHSQQEIRDRQDKLERDATVLLLEINDVKIIAEQAAADANEALEKVDDILNTGVIPAGMILTNSGQNQQQVNDAQEVINNRTTQQVDTIIELKNHTPRKNNQIVEVIDYDINVKGVFNKYIYRQGETIADNYGTVIASDVVAGRWLMLPKDEYYPRDFGIQASISSVENDNRLSAYITSGLNLVLPALSEYSFTVVKAFDINKPLLLRGSSMHSSIIKGISLYFETSDSRVTDVGLHTLVPQYTCYIRRGNRNVFTRVHAYHSYDGFAIYRNHAAPETEQLDGNQFIDCVSEKSGRVGFTVDIGAYRTLLKGCKAVDCRQGFHIEGAETTWIKDALTDGCGLGAAFDTGENVSYEGSLRSYGVKGLFVEGFKNINPNGRCQWQHGAASIGSSDLVFENMEGLGDLILDDENGTTQNLTVRDVPDFGAYQQNYTQLISGKILIENVDDGGTCQIGSTAADTIILRNTKLKLSTIGSSAPDSTLILDNTTFKHNRVSIFGAGHINIVNGIKNIQDGQADPAFYQGLRFDCSSLKTFFADHIELTGTSTGTHLSFYNSANHLLSGKIGKLFSDISFAIGYNGYVAAGLETFALLGIDYDSRKIVRTDAIPSYGKWIVGDMILKTVVGVDTIYGWICTTAGDGAAAIWQPLKYSV